jgi:hypothetical protein
MHENPIFSRSGDRLYRSALVDRLAATLVDTHGHAQGVVVGLTGPWGSGKSSFLNLLWEYITDNYPTVVTVRFNPWLITSADGLVSAFFYDVSEALRAAGTRQSAGDRRDGIFRVAGTVLGYGKRIAPAGNLVFPGAGTAGAAFLDAAQSAFERDGTLFDLRRRLAERLKQTNTHVLVLIDELDRLHDSEIALITQLVRSVADFENFSYLLAYDAGRVAEALGGGDANRGRAYLEKIVQLQIPLPPASDQTLKRLIELNVLARELSQHGISLDEERLHALLDVLVPASIATMRDVKRLIGAFDILEPMYRLEIDPVDLLGWSAVLTKYPTVERAMAAQKGHFIGDEATLFGEKLLDRLREKLDFNILTFSFKSKEHELVFRFENGEITIAERDGESISKLFYFLFTSKTILITSIRFILPLAKILSGGVLLNMDADVPNTPHPRHSSVDRDIFDKPYTALKSSLVAAERNGNLAEFLAALVGLGWRSLAAPSADTWKAFDEFCERRPKIGDKSRETPNRIIAKFLNGPWLNSLGPFAEFLGDPLQVVLGWIGEGHYTLAGHLLEIAVADKQEKRPPGLLGTADDVNKIAETLGDQCITKLTNEVLLEELADIACLRSLMKTEASGWNEAAYTALRESLRDYNKLDRFIWLCHAGGVPEESSAVQFINKPNLFLEMLKARVDRGFGSSPLGLESAYSRAMEATEFNVEMLIH